MFKHLIPLCIIGLALGLPQQHEIVLSENAASPMVNRFSTRIEIPDNSNFFDNVNLLMDRDQNQLLLEIGVRQYGLNIFLYSDQELVMAGLDIFGVKECVRLDGLYYTIPDLFANAVSEGSSVVDGVSVDKYSNVNFFDLALGRMFVSNKDQSGGIRKGDYIKFQEFDEDVLYFKEFDRNFPSKDLDTPMNPSRCYSLDDYLPLVARVQDPTRAAAMKQLMDLITFIKPHLTERA
ncbi:hypothetical protein MP228_002136 [Amoeboaphelidium protococcarum]|nr:hypothetical protein MP228_002136 [Amoeboaphelidium protococcarum]